jgi:hypothetical protein
MYVCMVRQKRYEWRRTSNTYGELRKDKKHLVCMGESGVLPSFCFLYIIFYTYNCIIP